MNALLWSLVLTPGVGGAVLCLSGRRAERIAVPLSLVVAVFVTGAAATVAAGRPTVSAPFVAGSTFGLSVDGLSAMIVPAVAAVSLLVLVYAGAEPVTPRPRFHGLMLLFVAAVMGTATATTLPALLFAWEVMGAASYALIGFSWRAQWRVSAGLTAFITTRTADLGLYLAAGAALAAGHGMSLAGLPQVPAGWRDVIAAGILVAAVGKSAQLPFAFWLSRAMAGPSPVSALLHSAAMVAMGGYLLLRSAPLLQATGWAATTTAWIGALTALILGAVAVAQRDLKQLLAASTAAQLGFVVLAAGLAATGAGAAQLIAHAATKALLFLVAGAWLAALGTQQLGGLRGAARRWPLIGVVFTVGALSLAGVAPLSLWATKDQVLAAALAEHPALYAVGLAAAALSAAYAGKMIVVVWSAHPAHSKPGAAAAGTGHVRVWQQVPLVVLALAAAAGGVLALPALLRPATTAIGLPAPAGPSVPELVGSAVLAVVVVAVVAVLRLPEPAWAARWLDFETAAHALVVRPVLVAADGLAWFDDRILDRSVGGVAVATARVAAAAGRADNKLVDAGVELGARQVRRLGHLARRPQTGQLHQYYVQAVVVLVAAAVLLWAVN